MWASLVYSLTFFLPPSRRLANYTFISWIIAYNLTILTLFLLTDLLVLFLNTKSKPKPKNIKNKQSNAKVEKDETAIKLYRVPNLVKAVDYNALLFFLLANIATGLVNMSVQTIHSSDYQSITILVGYQAVLGILFTILYKFNIKMKCW